MGSGERRAAHEITDHTIQMEGRVMSAMKRGIIVVLALALSGGLNGVMGQRGMRGGGMGLYGLGPSMGVNVELALEHQEELGLTSQQIASLQEMQAGIQQNVAPLETEITNLRTQIMEDEVDQEEGVAQLRELMEAYRTAAEPYRSGVTTILTVDQHRRLQAQVQSDRRAEGRLLGRAGVGRGVERGIARGAGRGVGRGVGRGAARGQGRGITRGGRFQQRHPARDMRQRMRVPLNRIRIIRGGGGVGDASLW